ncbi:hypothetical protein Nans01_14890 [Nocardiopsis ansamitocini]|uniref:Uncharacterized protein n=1 Tax=Nocardiopsis ansamitocini TaxID=1670832 RepID=A0A9W6P511_9ACTN|nr:hypothetical protein Nans01_14890 [Nocardiopsis ansamitocini]
MLLSIGGTYAYFTATDTTPSNEITAGDLTVEINERSPDGTSGPLKLGLVAPGGQWPASPRDSYSLVISNSGSILAEFEALDLTVTSEGTGNTPDLSEALEVRYGMVAGAREPDWGRGSGWIRLESGSVLETLRRAPATVPAGTSSELRFQLRWPNGTPEHDNRFQGADTEFVFSVRLGQV